MAGEPPRRSGGVGTLRHARAMSQGMDGTSGGFGSRWAPGVAEGLCPSVRSCPPRSPAAPKIPQGTPCGRGEWQFADGPA